MRRGDLVTVALQGDYGKPRPALVIQSDMFAAARSRTVLPLTSAPQDAPLLRVRVRVEPTPENGLRVPSWVMIDKSATVPADKIGAALRPPRRRNDGQREPLAGAVSRTGGLDLLSPHGGPECGCASEAL